VSAGLRECTFKIEEKMKIFKRKIEDFKRAYNIKA
jgi:hypothetical protein